MKRLFAVLTLLTLATLLALAVAHAQQNGTGMIPKLAVSTCPECDAQEKQPVPAIGNPCFHKGDSTPFTIAQQLVCLPRNFDKQLLWTPMPYKYELALSRIAALAKDNADLKRRVAELEKSAYNVKVTYVGEGCSKRLPDGGFTLVNCPMWPDGTYWPMIRYMDKDGNELNDARWGAGNWLTLEEAKKRGVVGELPSPFAQEKALTPSDSYSCIQWNEFTRAHPQIGLPYCGEHRWASEQQPPKGKENRLVLPRYAYGTPDCNRCTTYPLSCTAMYCPAGPDEESWTLDFCLTHGETRVLHSPEVKK